MRDQATHNDICPSPQPQGDGDDGFIDWYWDPISPFAWLAWRRLQATDLLPRLRPRPVLLAALLQAHGQLGPAEIPSKRRFTYRQVRWRALQQGLDLRFPPAHPFNPLPALRLALAAGADSSTVASVLDFVWAEGRDPSQPDQLAALAARLGVADANAALADPTVKQALHEHTAAAVAAGVFGVPTAVLAGEIYWGEDAVPMLLDRLQRGAAFEDAEFRRLDSLPIGIARAAAGR